MITKIDVERGYDSGKIRLGVSPNQDGIVASIGNSWFYFGGLTAEEYGNVEQFVHDIPHDTIVDEVYSALNSFIESGWEEAKEEYEYYEHILTEH